MIFPCDQHQLCDCIAFPVPNDSSEANDCNLFVAMHQTFVDPLLTGGAAKTFPWCFGFGESCLSQVDADRQAAFYALDCALRDDDPRLPGAVGNDPQTVTVSCP